LVKITRFHHFMKYPTKQYARHVSNPNFVRDGLILSCLSLFLELFGHLLVSIMTGIGYFIYIGRKELILTTIFFCLVAEYSRRFIGMRFGRFRFANYVAPKMSFEAALVCIFTPSIAAYFTYMFLTKYGLNNWKFNLKLTDYINLFGNGCGGLTLLGYLFKSFLLRCAGIDDNTSLCNLSVVSVSAKVESEQEKRERRINQYLKESNLV